MYNIKKSSEELFSELLTRYPRLKSVSCQIMKGYELMKECFSNGNTLYCGGNGGSAADCEHIVGELMKSFMFKRKMNADICESLCKFGEEGAMLAAKLEGGLRTVSLPSFVSLSSAVNNDIGGIYIFAQMIASLAVPGDIFLGISTSGNSANIVYAAMAAKAKGAKVLTLTGMNECRLDELSDAVIHVPETETFKIQEMHLPVYHALCAMIESEFFNPCV